MKKKKKLESKISESNSATDRKKWGSWILLYLAIPLACAVCFEFGKTWFYNKYPLEIDPEKQQIKGKDSLRYKIDIRNRSTRIVKGADIAIAVKSLRMDQISIMPTVIRHNDINPLIQDPMVLAGYKDGYLVYQVFYEKLVPGDANTIIVQLCEKGDCNPREIDTELEVQYATERLTYQFKGEH